VFRLPRPVATVVMPALAALALGACSPTVTTHGNLVPPQKAEMVKVGTSSKSDVEQIWGPPTDVAPFDDKTWYYVGEIDSQKGIYAPKVKKRQIIKVVFDQTDTVSSVTNVDPKLAQDVDIVTRKTPTAGKEFTAVQQFIGNLGKFNKDDSKKNSAPGP